MTVLVLGVDPGTERTGFCWKLRQSDSVWPTLNKGVVKPDRLSAWMDEDWPKWTALPHDSFIVVCEDYIQRPDKANATEWIKQGTAKVFGYVKREADRYGALFVPVLPGNLKSGTALAGIKWSGKSHLQDHLSAEAHAAYICYHGAPASPRSWVH